MHFLELGPILKHFLKNYILSVNDCYAPFSNINVVARMKINEQLVGAWEHFVLMGVSPCFLFNSLGFYF